MDFSQITEKINRLTTQEKIAYGAIILGLLMIITALIIR